MKKLFLGLVLSICIINFASAIGDAAVVVPLIEANTFQRATEHIENIAKMGEQINLTLKTIEGQYQQYQHMVEQAKSIDWSNFDIGDLNINEFKNPVQAIQAQMNLISAIKGRINSNVMTVNGHSYSIADMCGLNGSNKNIEQFFIDGVTEAQKRKNGFVIALTANLSNKERECIRDKFGVDAELYAVRKAQENKLKEALAEVVLKGNELTEEERMEYFNKVNNVLNTVLASDDVNPTQLLQTITMQNKIVSEVLQTLDADLNSIGTMLAQKELRDNANEAYSRGIKRKIDKLVTVTSDSEKVVRSLKSQVSAGGLD